MTRKDVFSALQGEIRWCLKNKTVSISSSTSEINNSPLYIKGFIDGLYQAVRLLRKVPSDH